jgi:TatD DNase family protein
MTYALVDTHAHLDEIDDLDTTLDLARKAGVAVVIAVGIDLDSNRKTLEIAARYPGFVYPALGWHPENVKEVNTESTLAFIKSHIAETVAVGEIGLDYSKWVRALADKDQQKQALNELLEIASAHDKPVLVHSRFAWKDTFDAVSQAGVKKAVFHWYTGTSSVLREIIARGYYLSATPAVAYHEEHRRAVKEAPLEQLLLETDSPVVYARGREGEFKASSADVVRSLKGLAVIKGLSEEEIAQKTTENAKRLFGLI